MDQKEMRFPTGDKTVGNICWAGDCERMIFNKVQKIFSTNNKGIYDGAFSIIPLHSLFIRISR